MYKYSRCDNVLPLFVIYISLFFFFKQKTAYEMRISDWSSDVCSSDLRLTTDAKTEAEGLLSNARANSERLVGDARTRSEAMIADARQKSDEIGRASCRERMCPYV